MSELLQNHNFKFQKKYGQNFLQDVKIPRRIAMECTDFTFPEGDVIPDEKADSLILEIGPGAGILTKELAKRFRKVVAVEIDTSLEGVLKDSLAGYDNIEVVFSDIMDVDLVPFLEEKRRRDDGSLMPVSVCSNLPYYITTPIIMKLLEEYPDFNVVGETWCENPAYTAWWQKDSKLSAPLNSNLKSVMDFHLWQVVNNSLTEETDSYMMGLNKVYHHFVYDYLYPDPSSVMAFVENHDTDRFLRNGENIDALKQAMVLLLTTRRIPQLYYGTEVMMNGTKEVTDGYVRKDFPGGWEGDKRNLFNAEERNAKEAEMFNFLSNILHWRKGNDVIAKGDLKHFIPQQGVYAYARSYEGKTVFVLLNGCDKAVDLRVKPYAEVLGDAKQGRDVISGNVVEWDTTIALPARGNMIIEL